MEVQPRTVRFSIPLLETYQWCIVLLRDYFRQRIYLYSKGVRSHIERDYICDVSSSEVTLCLIGKFPCHGTFNSPFLKWSIVTIWRGGGGGTGLAGVVLYDLLPIKWLVVQKEGGRVFGPSYWRRTLRLLSYEPVFWNGKADSTPRGRRSWESGRIDHSRLRHVGDYVCPGVGLVFGTKQMDTTAEERDEWLGVRRR